MYVLKIGFKKLVNSTETEISVPETRYEHFANLTVHFVNIYVKKTTNVSIIIQFISYIWWLLYVWALYCHPQGTFLKPSETRVQLRRSR
jgi:hypothetical protein